MTVSLVAHLKKTRGNSKVDFRWQNLRAIIKNEIKGKNILDAGCGTGHLTLELLQEGFNVVATDYSEELVDFAKDMLNQAGFSSDIFQLDLCDNETLKKEYFDTIICLDVIEHIDKDVLALQNLTSALKPGGILIISVPALNFLYSNRDKEIGHFRRYSKPEFQNKLISVNLEVTMIRFWNMIGVFPYFISEKVLKISIDNKVRNNDESRIARTANVLLNLWFKYVENNFRSPIGMSLIAICKKP